MVYLSLSRIEKDLKAIAIHSKIRTYVTKIFSHKVITKKPKEITESMSIIFKEDSIESEPIRIAKNRIDKFYSILVKCEISPFSGSFHIATVIYECLNPISGIAICKSALLVSLRYISCTLLYYF